MTADVIDYVSDYLSILLGDCSSRLYHLFRWWPGLLRGFRLDLRLAIPRDRLRARSSFFGLLRIILKCGVPREYNLALIQYKVIIICGVFKASSSCHFLGLLLR